jgi:hypothetical protein
MRDFEQWVRRAGFPRQCHQRLEQRAHRADALDQSITHDLGSTAWSASAVRLQECDQLLTQCVAR